MSLVFRPHRFKDKQGDIIQIDEMDIDEIFTIEPESLQVIFKQDDNSTGLDYALVDSIKDMQGRIEVFWNMGYIKRGAKNLSKCLRESIRMMECVRDGHPDSPPQNCEEKIQRLRDELAKLEMSA